MARQTLEQRQTPMAGIKLNALFEASLKHIRIAWYKVTLHEPDEIKRDRVISHVTAGCYLNVYQPLSRRSLRDIHYELHARVPTYDFNQMYRSMCIASRFRNEIDEFLKWYNGETSLKTLTAVYNILFRPNIIGYNKRDSSRYYNPFDAAMTCIDDMVTYGNRNETAFAEMTDKLTILRSYIDARRPVVNDFDDDTFFRFSPCCCCGKNPRATDGYDIFEAREGGSMVVIPVCSDCIAGGKEVNWVRVSQMYFLYSLSMQAEIERATGAPGAIRLGDDVIRTEID